MIVLSTVIDYSAALSLAATKNARIRKNWLLISLTMNLGLLGFFKYCNFFITEFQNLLSALDIHTNTWTLSIILPVGISFYTFQTLSYTLDVYNGKMKPTNNLIQFAAYVSFFPQLVAGPIERAIHLLPQFEHKRSFDLTLAKAGVRLIVWGLFKKIVIADNLAPVVNQIFGNFQNESGTTLIIGAVLFAFQIYGDFSGYSDIAIGTSRLLGFELMSNFRFPYFARNIGEFWRRWHISLSTWFRDYLYIPLGGSRGSKANQIRNIFIIFLVSGFWHGANWTFIVWGLIHALLFLPLFLVGSNRKHLEVSRGDKYNLGDWLSVLITFLFVCVGWIFFRSENISQAFIYISHLGLTLDFKHGLYLMYPILLLVLEWPIRYDERLEKLNLGRFEILILGLFMVLIFLFRESASDFIYFQF